LTALRELGESVSITAFAGESRSGKSHLASIFAKLNFVDGVNFHDIGEVFKSGNSGTPITKGIDMFIIPGTSNVIFDCEGGDHPFSPADRFVDVMALTFATQIVYVSESSIGESTFERLAQALAERAYRLPGVDEFRLQEQKLLMVVNKTTLEFSDEDLAKMVSVEGLVGKAREHRQLLHDNFSQVAVRIITNSNLNRNENFAALNNSLFSPMEYGGATLSGPQVTAFVEMIFEHWNSTDALEFPCVMKTMVEIKLRPQMDYLLIDFENSLPKDYQDNLNDFDYRHQCIARYKSVIQQAVHVNFYSYAEDLLTELNLRLVERWHCAMQLNDERGRQLVSEVPEKRSAYLDKKTDSDLETRFLFTVMRITSYELHTQQQRYWRKNGQRTEWKNVENTTFKMNEKIHREPLWRAIKCFFPSPPPSSSYFGTE